MKKVLIICGGPSSEYDVSISSSQAIVDNINYNQYNVSICIIGKDRNCIIQNLKEPTDISKITGKRTPFLEILPTLNKYDSILLGTHGPFGEDGTIQTYLEEYDIPYSGSDSYASRLAMDKYRSTLLVSNTLDIETPKTNLIRLRDLKEELQNTSLPVFVKPNKNGSSVCSYIVRDMEKVDDIIKEFQEYHTEEDEVLIQELIEDYIEVSCGCLEKKNHEFVELPPIEIKPILGEFFDYKSKYQKSASLEIIPAKSISEEMRRKISELAVEIHKLLGCRLYSRSDFLIKGEAIQYLETNTLPGMTETSLIPQEAKAIGMEYTDLISFYIENTK